MSVLSSFPRLPLPLVSSNTTPPHPPPPRKWALLPFFRKYLMSTSAAESLLPLAPPPTLYLDSYDSRPLCGCNINHTITQKSDVRQPFFAVECVQPRPWGKTRSNQIKLTCICYGYLIGYHLSIFRPSSVHISKREPCSTQRTGANDKGEVCILQSGHHTLESARG